MFILLPFCWLVLLVFYPQPAAPETPLPLAPIDFIFKSVDGDSALVSGLNNKAPIDFIFKSVDGGHNWVGVGKDIPTTKTPFSLWAEEATLYMGGSDGLYKGNTALPYVKWEKEMLLQDEITGIYPGQYGLYAVSHWTGLFQNEPLTGQWRPLHEHLKDKNIHTMLETSDHAVLACSETGIYKSKDKGKTWKQIFDKGPVYKLTESNGNLLCCSPSGLWRSTDSGATWSRTLTSVTEPFFVDAIGEDLVTITWGQEIGGIRLPNIVYLSSDQGQTWKPANQAWPTAMNNVYQLNKAGDFLFACSDNQIFRSADGGATWASVFKQGDQGNFIKLAVSGENIYALLIQGC